MRIDKRWLIAGVAAAAVTAGSVGIATAVATNEPAGPDEVVAHTQDDTQEAEDGRETDDFTERRHERPDSATAPDAQHDGEYGPGERPGDRGSDADDPRGPRTDGETEEGDVPMPPRGERGPGIHHRDSDRQHHAPQDTAEQNSQEQDGTGI